MNSRSKNAPELGTLAQVAACVRGEGRAPSVMRSECAWIGLNEFGIYTVGLLSRRSGGITTLGKAGDARRE